MIRTNLSTRPFYNERAVHLALAVAALITLGLTVFNISRAVTLSRRNTELYNDIARDEAAAQRHTAAAADIRRSINQVELTRTVDAAREANALIDQRTFSWTEFFNRIESTLPADVMLTQVRPQIKEGVAQVQMVVLSRRADDIEAFIDKLEGAGAFQGTLARQQEVTEDGLHRATLIGQYVPTSPSPAATAKSSKAAETMTARAGS